MRQRPAAPDVVVRFARSSKYPDLFVPANLDSRERAVFRRMRVASAHHDYLAAHAMARTVVGGIAGIDPKGIDIHSSALGRPVIEGPLAAAKLDLSISHADGMALCAVAAHHKVGVDVESARNIGNDPLAVAETICSAAEMEVLRATPRGALADRLLRVWTLKEAVAKATGLGLRLSPQQIPIDLLDGGRASVALASEDAPGPSAWHLALHALSPWHMVALAVRHAPGAHVTVDFDEYRPLLGLVRPPWLGGGGGEGQPEAPGCR